MTTTVETPEQEYGRLTTEGGEIQSAARAKGELTPELREALRPIRARLSEITTIPPAGYATPKAVTDLVDFARAHGWLARVQWTPPGWEGEPFLQVQVGRKLSVEEAAECRSDDYLFQLTWHSRGCPPGRVTRFRSGLARTPDRPQWYDAPSVKGIRAVIEQNPAPNHPAA